MMSAASSVVCSNSGSFSGVSSLTFSGEMWCSVHNTNDWCYLNTSNGPTYDPNTFTVPYWPTYPATGTPCVPTPFTFTPTALECALCDNALEFGDKKVCKSCKGVLDAWKFLSKKDETEEK